MLIFFPPADAAVAALWRCLMRGNVPASYGGFTARSTGRPSGKFGIATAPWKDSPAPPLQARLASPVLTVLLGWAPSSLWDPRGRWLPAAACRTGLARRLGGGRVRTLRLVCGKPGRDSRGGAAWISPLPGRDRRHRDRFAHPLDAARVRVNLVTRARHFRRAEARSRHSARGDHREHLGVPILSRIPATQFRRILGALLCALGAPPLFLAAIRGPGLARLSLLTCESRECSVISVEATGVHVTLQAVLKSQYHASLAMLLDAVESCPADLWTSDAYVNPYWQVAYHALFYTDLYLQPDESAFTPWEHHRPEHHRFGPRAAAMGPLLPYTSVEVAAYGRHCDAMVDTAVDRLDLSASRVRVLLVPDAQAGAPAAQSPAPPPSYRATRRPPLAGDRARRPMGRRHQSE